MKIKDSLSDNTLEEVVKVLNDKEKNRFVQKSNLDYPIQLDYSSMKFLSRGSCEHCTNYVIFIMRGLGIPVSKETSPFQSNKYHKWTALHTKGNVVPFESCSAKNNFDLMYEGSYKNINESGIPSSHRKIARVERFFYNIKSTKNNTKINEDKYDVNSEYVDVSDVNINVKHSYFNNRYYSLFVFNRKLWEPQYFSSSRTNKVKFEQIPNGVIYLPRIIDGNNSSSAGNPFILDNEGDVQEIKLDKENRQNIVLTRKYPLGKRMRFLADNLIGSRFQVANSIDFKDSVTVGVIKKTPLLYIQDIDVNLKTKYRYFRVLFPKNKYRISISEIIVFDKENKKPHYGKFINDNVSLTKKVFDNNLMSFAQSKANSFSWLGMDFGKLINIGKISYLQRSALNMIIKGNKYELVYWDNEWVSLGSQIATSNKLIYNDVPKNALFLLHNLTEGKEERVFIYKKGKQLFY